MNSNRISWAISNVQIRINNELPGHKLVVLSLKASHNIKCAKGLVCVKLYNNQRPNQCKSVALNAMRYFVHLLVIFDKMQNLYVHHFVV